MRKNPTFKNNQKAYLEKLRKAGKRATLTYLDIPHNEEGYPYACVQKSSGVGVRITRWTGSSPAYGMQLNFDEIEMIAAYAEGLKQKK